MNQPHRKYETTRTATQHQRHGSTPRLRALVATALVGASCLSGFAASADNLRFAIAAYNGDGKLEPAVSGDGKFTTMFPPHVGAVARATAVDPVLGRLYVAGQAGADHIALARYDYSGNLDLNFGNGGRVLTPVNSAGTFSIRDLAIDSNSRIVVVGHRGTSALLARYLPNGTLDSSFDGDGILEFGPFGEYGDFEAMAVAITGGRGYDRIVISGDAGKFAVFDRGVLIARFLHSGKPDPTFGSGQGFVIDNVPTLDKYRLYEAARDVAVDKHGRIVVAGVSSVEVEAYDFEQHVMQVQRYLADGQPDPTFGSNGPGAVSPFEPSDGYGYRSHGNSLLIDAEGRIVVAGQANWGTDSFAIARLTPDGLLDNSFSGDGRTLVAFGTFGTSEVTDIALAANGDVLAAGWVGTINAGHQRFALARLRNDGSLDTGFDGDGRVDTDFTCHGESSVAALAVRPYEYRVFKNSFERIYAVGWAEGAACSVIPGPAPTPVPAATRN